MLDFAKIKIYDNIFTIYDGKIIKHQVLKIELNEWYTLSSKKILSKKNIFKYEILAVVVLKYYKLKNKLKNNLKNFKGIL